MLPGATLHAGKSRIASYRITEGAKQSFVARIPGVIFILMMAPDAIPDQINSCLNPVVECVIVESQSIPKSFFRSGTLSTALFARTVKIESTFSSFALGSTIIFLQEFDT